MKILSYLNIAIAILVACRPFPVADVPGKKYGASSSPAPTNPSQVPSSTQSPDSKLKSGTPVEVSYQDSSQYADIRNELIKLRSLESFADSLNKTLILPKKLTLTMRQCGEIQASYKAEIQTVTLCYEFVDWFYSFAKTDPKLTKAHIRSSLNFVMLHEIGHGLVHLLALPITGKEEDAVDQFASYYMINLDQTEDLILSASVFVMLETLRPKSLWAVHSLNGQRFYNILCWAYGRDPAKYVSVVNDGYLPKERAKNCSNEFNQLDSSWQSLLQSHMIIKSPTSATK